MIGGYGLRDNDYRILMNAYDFTIDDDGFLHGLLNGDLGYEKTGLKIMYNIIDSFAELPCAGNEKPEVLALLPTGGNKMITNFDGEFAFLSNFFSSPMIIDGKVWATAEHVYQASKTCDEKEREGIRLAPTPGNAKRLGQKVSLRPDWEDEKQTMMSKTLRLKFKQNSNLASMLLATKHVELIEGNHWHDNFWGNCQCSNCNHIEGRNLLGKMLMTVRSELS
jgi:ribA/ribD-fused uncharacterized protein